MHFEIFYELAKSLGRPELLAPLALGFVPTELFALALGLKKPSSLSKKRQTMHRMGFDLPPAYALPGTRRHFHKLEEIAGWSPNALVPLPLLAELPKMKEEPSSDAKKGTSLKEERVAARQLGISVSELRRQRRGNR